MSRTKKELKMLTTVSDVLAVLDGYASVAKRFGDNPQRTWNWTVQHTFPKDTYAQMISWLADAGYTAPASLWAQRAAAPVSPVPAS
jgi:hypothetical protein